MRMKTPSSSAARCTASASSVPRLGGPAGGTIAPSPALLLERLRGGASTTSRTEAGEAAGESALDVRGAAASSLLERSDPRGEPASGTPPPTGSPAGAGLAPSKGCLRRRATR